MIEYSNDKKYAYFNGLKYTRDDNTGLYLNSTVRKRLHRAVWMSKHGVIPEGYHIHHIDGDRSNNDIENLSLLLGKKHWEKHGKEMFKEKRAQYRESFMAKALPAAAKWHGSDAGKEWHRKQYLTYKDKFHELKNYVCDYCGASFQSTAARARFCSGKCKAAFRRATRLDNEKIVCAECSREFETNKYSSISFCSRSCASKAGSKTRRVS